MNPRRTIILASSAILLALFTLNARAWQVQRKLGYTDTPMQPNGKWRVHDGTRPQPPIVTPGTPSTQEIPGRPPSDAVVLFNGNDLARWQSDGGKPSACKIENGIMVITGGSAVSRDFFGDCQLHLEFASPNPPQGEDQARGNSGVMMFGRYEIQVLDSYQNLTYPDGQAAAVYGQTPPLVNASRKPGDWQTYDLIFTAPRFKQDGSLEAPAYLTMLHNGVLVHNHTAILGSVAFRSLAKYEPHDPKGPIVLQDHGNPVRFRNIWVRELKSYDQP